MVILQMFIVTNLPPYFDRRVTDHKSILLDLIEIDPINLPSMKYISQRNPELYSLLQLVCTQNPRQRAVLIVHCLFSLDGETRSL
jgi:hypothetical protein